MRKLQRLLFLCCFLTATVAIGQDDGPESRGVERGDSRVVPGAYTDGPGMRLFQVLGWAHFSYPPMTFAEAVETSSVIVKGYLTEILHGRTIRSSLVSRSSPGMNTAFLKIVPSNVLKGDREDYYLVEVQAPAGNMDELKAERYDSELVLLLGPGHNWVLSPEITLWPDAQAEWALERPLYDLTRRSMVFTMTGTGKLASPLDPYHPIEDFYENFDSLAAVEAHIVAILADQPSENGETAGGFREWGETGPIERVEPELEEGVSRTYYPNGQLRFEYNVVNGELKEGRHWHQNGQLLREATFEDGERVSCRAWTPDGAPTSCQAPSLLWQG